jgi:phosphatidylglycerol---prolipoprotein diacylglyceryl transferase
VHKIAFQIGSLTVHWYGVFLAVGFLVGLWTAGRRGLRAGLPPEKILDSGVWLIVGGIVGARLFYVITYWDESFAGRPFSEVFMVQHGGLVYYGGLIGASLAFVAYAYFKNLPLWKLADVLAPSISLGYAIGRYGCLMNGCCYGRPTDMPWAIHFPSDHETHGVGVHPTQIYESLLAFGLYLFLAWLFRRKKFDGQVFAAYLVGYALLRSVVEFFRGDYVVHYLGGWATQAHLVSFAGLVAGIILLFVLPRFSAKPAKPV